MTIQVFTTRVDTIFGATSVQLAPEHAIVKHWKAMDSRRPTGYWRRRSRR